MDVYAESGPVRAGRHAVRACVYGRAAMRAVAGGSDDRAISRGCAHGPFQFASAPDVITAPEVLRTKNYYTGVCGRYFHLDGVVNASPTTEQVYEAHQMRTWKNRVDFLNISSQGPTPRLFEEFLGKVPQGRPWFFWINYNDPHHPWDRDAGHVDPAKVKLPPHPTGSAGRARRPGALLR